MFMDAMEKTLNNDYNVSVTENGAIGYQTSGKNLLDLNFAVASLRKCTEDEIISKFIKAYYENPMLAVKWLFYLSDVREGLGERRTFNVIMKWLCKEHTDIAKAVIQYIPVYSRWDNLVSLIDCGVKEVEQSTFDIIDKQILEDLQNYKNNKPISLLAKWLPSVNTSSKQQVDLAKKICKLLGLKQSEYRKMLSRLRSYLNVVECKMSSKKWENIDYSTVPSKANLKYNNAFMRNDKERREEYLNALKNGETKINSSVNFPHEIVHKYNGNSFYRQTLKYDETLEQLWKNLKDIGDIKNTIVVSDGSGSMCLSVDYKSKVTALDVSQSLALYCGERCSGEFKDKFITFSSNPHIIDFSNCKTLCDKITLINEYDDITNTNIERVFDLILDTATSNNMLQCDIPKNVLIISDMEFDIGVLHSGWWDENSFSKECKTLFATIEEKYKAKGYKMPKLIFWNVNSRTNTIPVKENENGVILVSGFSVNTMKMVLNEELDPYKALLKELNSNRYSVIEQAISDIVNK